MTLNAPSDNNTLISGIYDINVAHSGEVNISIELYNGTWTTINSSINEIIDPYIYSFNTSAYPDYNNYTLNVTVVNSTNATDLASVLTFNITIDNNPPLVTPINPTSSMNISGSYNFTVNVIELGTNVTMVNVSNGTAGTNLTMTNYSGTLTNGNWSVVIDTTLLDDGEQIFTYSTTDATSNINGTTFVNVTVDNTNPVLTVVTAPSANSIQLPTYVLNGTVSDLTLDAVTIWINGAAIGNATVTSGVWNYTVVGADGLVHNITINATDGTGHSNTSTILNVTLDGLQPMVTITNPTNNSFVQPIYVINGTVSDANGVDSVSIIINDFTAVAATVTGSTWSYNASGMHGLIHNITVNATDNVGNSNVTSVTNVTLNDSVAPIITLISSGDLSTTSATISWTTGESANASVNYGETTSLGTTTIDIGFGPDQSLDLSDLTASTKYYYNVTSCDAAGNCNTSGPNNFTTDATTTGGSGGGGITSGQYLSRTKQRVSLTMFGSFFFQVSGDSVRHTLRVKTLGDDQATLTIASTPQEVTLKVGESADVDVTDDGTPDLTIELDAVSAYNAQLFLSRYDKEIAPLIPEREEEVIEDTTPAEAEPIDLVDAEIVEEVKFIDEPEAPVEDEQDKSGFAWWLWLIVGALLVAILFFAFRKPPEETDDSHGGLAAVHEHMKKDEHTKKHDDPYKINK